VVASGWFVNWSVAALAVLVIGCLVIAVSAGRFRRRPRRIIRTVAFVLAPLFAAAWIVAEVTMPGPSLGGAMLPWTVLPSAFADEQKFWGAGYGAHDPRDQQCRSAEDLAANGIFSEATPERLQKGRTRPVHFPLVLEGHFSGPFGGANVFEPSGVPEDGSPAWYLVEVAHDCYLVYGPAPGEG